MQQDVLLHFGVIFLHWNQAETWKNLSFCPALELFLPLLKTVLFVCSRAFSQACFFIVYPHFLVVHPYGKQWGYMEKSYKMQQRKNSELRMRQWIWTLVNLISGQTKFPNKSFSQCPIRKGETRCENGPEKLQSFGNQSCGSNQEWSV